MSTKFLDDLPPEKVITVKIKAREAALIKLLRRYEYGTIIITKQKGYLIKAEPQESIILKEEDGLELAKGIVQQP